MSTGKSKPPFKRGEWVRIFSDHAPVMSMEFVGDVWWCKTTCTELPAKEFRRSTAKQLRAESKRLADRASVLATAADAVESKPRKNRK